MISPPLITIRWFDLPVDDEKFLILVNLANNEHGSADTEFRRPPAEGDGKSLLQLQVRLLAPPSSSRPPSSCSAFYNFMFSLQPCRKLSTDAMESSAMVSDHVQVRRINNVVLCRRVA